MRGRRRDCDSRRYIEMKLLKLALLSLAAFSNPVQALQVGKLANIDCFLIRKKKKKKKTEKLTVRQ